MALSTMYKAKPNSPQTTLAADISAADTSMTVADATVLPTAPNLCTIGDDENAEVVIYTTITGNVVSGLIRGASGTTASVWTAGTVVARDFTSYDHDTFIDNINDLNSNKLDSVNWGDIGGTLADQSDLNTALGNKADLATEIMYFYQQTVNAASNAEMFRITNANVTTDTVVLECTFAAPANITSNVSWTSYSGYIAFTGTCTAGTTANVTLGKKGN